MGVLKRILNFLLHLVAMGVVVAVLKPVADWYLSLAQIPGSDYWNTGTYLQKLSQDLRFPAGKWFYHWFTGTPATIDYPWLHLYLMQPLVRIWGVIQAQSYYALGSLAVFGIFSYLWLERVVNNGGGKTNGNQSELQPRGFGDRTPGVGVWAMVFNKVFAAALSVALLYSLSLYPALITIGSTTFLATQAFLPMTLYFLESWRQGGSTRWFYLAVMATGLTMYGHPAIGLVFVVPLGLIVIGLSRIQAKYAWALRYAILSFLVGGAGLGHFFTTIMKSFSGGSAEKYMKLETVPFEELFPGGVASWNYVILGALGVALALWLVSKLVIALTRRHPELDSGSKRSKQIPDSSVAKAMADKRNDEAIKGDLKSVSRRPPLGNPFGYPWGGLAQPYMAGLVYLAIFFGLMMVGVNPLSGLLHGPRLAWVGVLIITGLTAALYGELASGKPKAKLVLLILKLFAAGGALALAAAIWWYRPILLELIKQHAGHGYPYPAVMSRNLRAGEIERLWKVLTPEWLDTEARNYRLYSLDDRLNMWWNGLYDLPLVRGYYAGVSPPEKEAFLGQLDTSTMENEMMRAQGLTVEEATAVAKFYLNWHGVKYLGLTHRTVLSSYLKDESSLSRRETAEGVNYAELSSEISSPILAANNSPTLCVLGSDRGYNYLLRTMARWGWDSEQLVMIKGPSRVSQVSEQFLSACDSLVIYDLKSGVNVNPLKGKSGWSAISARVKQGAGLWIESGEANSVGNQGYSLPEVFPVGATEQKTVEGAWQWQVAGSDIEGLLAGVEVKDFSPPKWEEFGWRLSEGKSDTVRDWAEVILKQENDVVLAQGELGEGEVVWSGLNLPFHADYYQDRQEMGLMRKMVELIVMNKLKNPSTSLRAGSETKEQVNAEAEKSLTNVEWISPEERRITVSKAKGVLFKENGWPGWAAKTDMGERLKILKAGPNYPGFMYVALPEGFAGTVDFEYRGSPVIWISFGVAGLVIILILEQILIKGKLTGMLWGSSGNKFRKTFSLKKWWEEEE